MNAIEITEKILKKLKAFLLVETLLEIAFLVLCIVPQWAVIQFGDGRKILTFYDVSSSFSSQGAAVDLIIVGLIMLFLLWKFVWSAETMENKKCYFLIPLAIQVFIMGFVLLKYVPGEMSANHGHLLPLAYIHVILFVFTVIVGISIPVFLKTSRREINDAREREKQAAFVYNRTH